MSKLNIVFVGCDTGFNGHIDFLNQFTNQAITDPSNMIADCIKYSSSISINDEQIQLSLFAPANEHSYAYIRRLYYENADIIVMHYQSDYKGALAYLERLWLPEIRESDSKATVVLLKLENNSTDIKEQDLNKKMKDFATKNHILPLQCNKDQAKDTMQTICKHHLDMLTINNPELLKAKILQDANPKQSAPKLSADSPIVTGKKAVGISSMKNLSISLNKVDEQKVSRSYRKE